MCHFIFVSINQIFDNKIFSFFKIMLFKRSIHTFAIIDQDYSKIVAFLEIKNRWTDFSTFILFDMNLSNNFFINLHSCKNSFQFCYDIHYHVFLDSVNFFLNSLNVLIINSTHFQHWKIIFIFPGKYNIRTNISYIFLIY